MTGKGKKFQVAEEAADALASGHPVVALESTLISHGLPTPRNLETAHASEEAVRKAGAVPATVAVIDGVLKVGLAGDEFERLTDRANTLKVSRRDLGPALASGATGSTTVAATMIAAAKAGIEVFATGGIGGVHIGAQDSFDISADLHELARTDVTVVCSGMKSVLDLPRTREVLETLGVPVLGYRTRDLPGFWTASCGLAVDTVIDDLGQLRALREARRQIGLTGGTLLCNPPPADLALGREEVEGWVAQAMAAAQADKIAGRELTPFLLGRIAQLSGGRTLETNVALIVANAGLAGEAAAALAAAEPEED